MKNKSIILSQLRDAGNLLYIIEKIHSNKNIKELEGFNVGIIKDLFFHFKEELTDSPFRNDIHTGTVISFNRFYTELCEKLYEYMIKTCF